MKKIIDITKKIALVAIVFLGMFFFKFFGDVNTTFLMMSVIIFGSVYFLMRFWYPKAAKIYGIVIVMLLGSSLIHFLE